MQSIFNGGLNLIEVNKAELLAKLEENRSNHIQLYEKAVQAFIKQSISELQNYWSKSMGGDIPDRIVFDHPKSHEQEYTLVIEMLQMSVETTVKISASEFKSFVKDDWDWKQSFISNVTKYVK